MALPRWLNFQPSLVMIDISAWIASELGLSFKQSWDGHPSELSTVLSSRSYPEVFIQNLHVRCFVTIFLIKAAYLVIILVQYNLSNLVCNIKSPRPYIHLINPCSSFLLWRLALQEAQNKSVIYMKWPAVVIGANTYCLFCSEIMMGAWVWDQLYLNKTRQRASVNNIIKLWLRSGLKRVCRTCLPIGLNAYFFHRMANSKLLSLHLWNFPTRCAVPYMLCWFNFCVACRPTQIQSVMMLPVFGRNRPEGKILETVGVFEAVKQHGKYETGQVRPSHFIHAYTEADDLV